MAIGVESAEQVPVSDVVQDAQQVKDGWSFLR